MPAEADLSPLGPVLELAIVIAQAGERAMPHVAAPAGLRPFLHFTRRVPPPALRAAKKVLDENVDYRARVASVATEELVGRAGTLFVQRPEGWLAELEDLLCATGAAEQVAAATGNERQLERRLRGAEESAKRAELATARAEEALARAKSDAASASAAARDDRTARAELAQELLRTQASLAAQRGANDAAVRDLGIAQAAVARLQSQSQRDQIEIAALRNELGGRVTLDNAVANALDAIDRVRSSVADLHAAAQVRALGPDVAGLAQPAGGGGGADGAGDTRGGTGVASRPTPSRADRARVADELRNAGRRVPVALPLAVFEESTEAVQFLLRVPNVIVLVDGYNVSKQRWGDRSPSEQRQRLIDALGELEARTGAEILVVFDGAEIAGPAPVSSVGRRPVRVMFSPPDVEADDVLIELAASLPVSRAVVVVSGDKRVIEGGRRWGANTVSSAQLLAVLGSAPGGPSFLSYPSR